MAAFGAVGLQLASGILITYPQEVVEATYKTNYQPAVKQRYTGVVSVARNIFSREGYVGLLRGLFPSLAFSTSYTLALEFVSRTAFRLFVPGSSLEYLFLRESINAFTRAILSPLTTLVTRFITRPEARRQVPGALALQPGAILRATAPATSSDAEKAQSTSSLRSLYAYNPRVMLLEAGASAAAGLANSLIVPPLVQLLYTFGSGLFLQLNSEGWQQVLMLSTVCATGVIVRATNLALDTVSKRLQVQDKATPATAQDDGIVALRPRPYTGIRDAFARIVEEEGASSLFRGWTLYTVSALALSSLSVLVAVSEGSA